MSSIYFVLLYMPLMSTLLNLNVGGTTFTTTLSTLCSDSNSVLAAMFNPGMTGLAPAIKDANGAYFIDRDPKVFAVILGFLRTGKVFLDFAGVSSEQAEVEADYFGLDGLLELLRKKSEDKIPAASPDENERQLILYQDDGGRVVSATIDVRSPMVFGTSHICSYCLYGSLGRISGGRDGIVPLDEATLPERRTLMFLVAVGSHGSPIPKLTGIERLDVERRIHDNWDFYWKRASACSDTQFVQVFLKPLQDAQ